MPKRLKPALALGGAAIAGLLAFFLLNPHTGLIVFISLTAGITLGRFSISETAEALVSSPQVANSHTKTLRPASYAPVSALLEAMMSGVREGVLIVDQEMRVVASNSAALAVFKRYEGALEGARVTSLTRNLSVHAAFSGALERGEHTEVKVELLGEERRAFDMRVMPLRADEDNGARVAIGVFFDITRLERLERVRQEFLTNVSHELRTPLTSILAFVETLEEGAIHDASNSSHFLSIIRRNAVRMQRLIEDILELSSIEAGTVTLKVERVQLRPLVDDIMVTLAVKARAFGIMMRNNINDDAVVLADPHRLEQMLTNLIDNAIKFNCKGGSVTVAFESGSRDCILVSDTGEGIPSEHIKRIFERFYRVDRSRSPASGGTGLGLAIVKHLARAQGGEVRVLSTSNNGSTFIIELPAINPSVISVA